MPHSFSIDELLEQCVALGASDLHVTVGSPPVVRVRGELEALDGADVFDAESTQTLLYRIPSTSSASHSVRRCVRFLRTSSRSRSSGCRPPCTN